MRDDEDDEYDDDRPRRRKKRRREESGPPVALILGILAGAFILIGGSVGAYFALRSKPKADPTEAAQKPNDLVPGIKNGDLPAALGLLPGWTDFTHPEGLYTAKVPAKPVQMGPPDNGSIFAPSKAGFANSTWHVAASKYLNGSMTVAIHTQGGLDAWKRADDQLGPKKLGPDATRKKVTWAGHDAVEDRFEFKRSLTVRRTLFIGNVQYEFTLMGSDGRPTQEEQDAFFNSFQPKKGK